MSTVYIADSSFVNITSEFSWPPRAYILRMEKGVKDQIEQFNWQRDEEDEKFPSTMQPFLPDVRKFCQKCHQDVLFKVYRRKSDVPLVTSSIFLVFALALRVPSETFVDMHKYEEHDDSWFRCTSRLDWDEFTDRLVLQIWHITTSMIRRTRKESEMCG